jgi:hypothetical protein
MFAKLERLGSRSEQGLGIGLALARRLSELHDGALEVSSKGEGQGSTFTLSLPAAAPVAKQPPAQPANGKSRAASTLRILVIEDNDDIADTLSDLLSDLVTGSWWRGMASTASRW